MITILRTPDNRILRTSANAILSIHKLDFFYPEYALLYNWYAATDPRYIAPIGWHVPTHSEWLTLTSYFEWGLTGGALKETGLTHWLTPNTGANNSTGFNGRGAGERADSSGIFMSLNSRSPIWASDIHTEYSTRYSGRSLTSGSADIGWWNIGSSGDLFKKRGCSIRLIKDSTTLSQGETGNMTGNDGKVYRTTAIGNGLGNVKEWIADNLTETKFRNGDIIPWYGTTPASYFTNAQWIALTTSACCAYNNTLSNVASGFTFPT